MNSNTVFQNPNQLITMIPEPGNQVKIALCFQKKEVNRKLLSVSFYLFFFSFWQKKSRVDSEN